MSASAPNYLNTTLYVGDLHHAVTEAMLFDKFSRVAPVVSIRLCRHVITRRSLGYAYVNFRDPAGAEHALKTMNFELIMGRPIRIMWSQRDPSLRKSGIGNIFVKNLEKSIDSLALKNMFSRFGNILSCKVACNSRGSKGYGFVHFETMEAAENAIIEMNGALFNDRKVFVGHFRSRQERETKTGDKEKDFTNIYIKNFGKDMNDKRLKETFGKYGPTVSVRVMTDNWGKSKGFGFVSYQRHEDAERAVDSMNGTEINGRRIYVARAQKWAERRAAQICQLEQKKQETMTTHYQAQNVNAYNPINQMAQLIPGRCWAPESMWSQDLQIFPGHPRLSVPYFGNVLPALTQVPDEMTYLKFDTRNPMRFPIGLPVDATPMSGVTQFGCTAGVDDSLEQLSTQPQCTLMQPTIPEPLTISLLASLSNDDREQTLGHRLYPLIQDQKPDLAPKITGMLLELENSEILQLLESSESLHSKVDEAVAVLQAFWASEATAAGLASRAVQDNCTAGEHNPEQQKINPPPQGTKQQPAVPLQKQDPLTLSYLDGLSYNDRDQILGKHLHSLILGQQPDLAPKITGMLLELENTKILKFLETPESLHAKVSEAVSVLQDFWAKEAETKANAEKTVTTEVNAEEAVTTEGNVEETMTTKVNAEH